MRILILGSGGREHSLAWAIAQNPICEKLFCIPGNAGISKIAECFDVDINNQRLIVDFCIKKEIDFVVIGPEAPLASGVSDALRNQNIKTFGPSKMASKLESSKSFTKSFCKKANIPTADFQIFSSLELAIKYISKAEFPIVIKADGLASGKGVFITSNAYEAIEKTKEIFNGVVDGSGNKVVIEEFLHGQEVSYFVLSDGKRFIPICSVQDYKKAFDGDLGPNTGGMGAICPAPHFPPEIENKVLKNIIKPTIEKMKQQGTPYIGVLYAGLMISNGEPYLIEYNVRFGDPECQAIMVRIGGQILDLLLHCCEGTLDDANTKWAQDHSLVIVLASKGYPDRYKIGSHIPNLKNFQSESNVEIFHAGTSIKNRKIISSGGRVLNLTVKANNLQDARERAYNLLKEWHWKEGYFRKDIGLI